MKVMAPVIKGHADSIEVKKGPEIAYRDWIEKSHKDSVWSNEYCRSVSGLFLPRPAWLIYAACIQQLTTCLF